MIKLNDLRNLVNECTNDSLDISGIAEKVIFKIISAAGEYEAIKTLGDLKGFLQRHPDKYCPGLAGLELEGTELLENRIFWAIKAQNEKKKEEEPVIIDPEMLDGTEFAEKKNDNVPAGGEYIAPGETRELAPGITMTPQGGGMVMISGDDLKKMGGGSMSEGLRKMQQKSRRNAFLDGLNSASGGKMSKEVRDMLEKELEKQDEEDEKIKGYSAVKKALPPDQLDETWIANFRAEQSAREDLYLGKDKVNDWTPEKEGLEPADKSGWRESSRIDSDSLAGFLLDEEDRESGFGSNNYENEDRGIRCQCKCDSKTEGINEECDVCPDDEDDEMRMGLFESCYLHYWTNKDNVYLRFREVEEDTRPEDTIVYAQCYCVIPRKNLDRYAKSEGWSEELYKKVCYYWDRLDISMVRKLIFDELAKSDESLDKYSTPEETVHFYAFDIIPMKEALEFFADDEDWYDEDEDCDCDEDDEDCDCDEDVEDYENDNGGVPAGCPRALPEGWRTAPVQAPAPTAPDSGDLPKLPYLTAPVPDEELSQFPRKLISGDKKETMYVSDDEVVLRSDRGDRRFSRVDIQAIEFYNRLAITVKGYEYFFSVGRDYKAKEVREAFPDLYWMAYVNKALINLAHVNPDPDKTYASDSEEDLTIGFFGEGNPSISLETFRPADLDEDKLRKALKTWSRTHFVGQSLIEIDPKAQVITWITPEKRRNQIRFDEVLYATETSIRYRLRTDVGSIPMQGGLTLEVFGKFFPKFYKYREVGGDPVSYLINLKELDIQNTRAEDEEDWKMAFKNCTSYHWVFSSNPERAVEKICKAAALS